MQESLPRYAALGVKVVGIVGQAASSLRRYEAKHPFRFPLLVDEDRSVIKSYGVYNLLWFDAYNIARPAVFLVDTERVIRRIFVGESQWDRPTQEVVLEALEEIVEVMGDGQKAEIRN